MTAPTPVESGGETLQVEGHFACGPGLVVTGDCLGRTYRTRTTNRALSVTLPALAPGAGSAVSPLISPEWSSHEPDHQKDTDQTGYAWGTSWVLPVAGKDGSAAVRAVVTRWRFEMAVVRGADQDPHTARSQPMVEVEKWWELFSDWVGVLSNLDIAELVKKQRGIRGEALWTWVVASDGLRALTGKTTSLTFRMADEEALDHVTLSRCMELCASQTSPPEAWLLIRDAKSLCNAGQYRRAVIDAGTAAEVAMNELLDRYFAGTDEKVRDLLYSKYQTLGGRAQLLGKLDAGTVPDRMQQLLSEPRNMAAHNGWLADRQTASNAIETAVILVEQAFPRAVFFP